MLNLLLKQSPGTQPSNTTTTSIEITPLGIIVIAIVCFVIIGFCFFGMFKAMSSNKKNDGDTEKD